MYKVPVENQYPTYLQPVAGMLPANYRFSTEREPMRCRKCNAKTRVINVVSLADDTVRQVICPICKTVGVTRETWDTASEPIVEQAVEQQAQKPIRAANDPQYQAYRARFERLFAGRNAGIPAKFKSHPMDYQAWLDPDKRAARRNVTQALRSSHDHSHRRQSFPHQYIFSVHRRRREVYQMRSVVFFGSIAITGLLADGNISIGIAVLAYIMLICALYAVNIVEGRL